MLDSVSFTDSGEEVAFLRAKVSIAEFPSGWVLLLWDHSDEGVKSKWHKALSKDTETVGLFVEEHVMVSRAVRYVDGLQIWSVEHNPDKGLSSLEVAGDPPPQLADVALRLKAWRDADGGDDAIVDHLIEGPVELAQVLTGFRHDQFEFSEGAVGFTRLIRGNASDRQEAHGRGRTSDRIVSKIQTRAVSVDENILAHIGPQARRRYLKTLYVPLVSAVITVGFLAYWMIFDQFHPVGLLAGMVAWCFGTLVFLDRATYFAILFKDGRAVWIENQTLRVDSLYRTRFQIPLSQVRGLRSIFPQVGDGGEASVYVHGSDWPKLTFHRDAFDVDANTMLEGIAARAGLRRWPDEIHVADGRWVEAVWGDCSNPTRDRQLQSQTP